MNCAQVTYGTSTPVAHSQRGSLFVHVHNVVPRPSLLERDLGAAGAATQVWDASPPVHSDSSCRTMCCSDMRISPYLAFHNRITTSYTAQPGGFDAARGGKHAADDQNGIGHAKRVGAAYHHSRPPARKRLYHHPLQVCSHFHGCDRCSSVVTPSMTTHELGAWSSGVSARVNRPMQCYLGTRALSY